MTFDFDEPISRTGTQSIKWDWAKDDELPLWVADMDFRSPEPVIQALQERVAHGVFGYTHCPPALKTLLVERLARLYDWVVDPQALVFLPGVVTGFNQALSALANPGDGVLIQTPVYPPILQAWRNFDLVSHDMQLTQTASGRYEVDLDLFASAITSRTRVFLLCNPHNPVGRVFTREELLAMAELCLEHDLFICSDEIHGDLIFSGRRHIPIAALAPDIAARTITLMAPSKTFNVAGLGCSFAVIPDATLRERFTAAHRGLTPHVNLLGYTAALAAYRDGQPWLDAILAYLETNRDLVASYVQAHLPGVHVARPEGTYLAWLDCREAGIPGNPYTFFREQARVMLNDGASFGPGGEGFVRLNFGASRALLEEALARMRAALATL